MTSGIYGIIILKWTWTECDVMDWIHLAQNTDRCRAVVNTVMNIFGSIKDEEFIEWLSDRKD